MKQIIRLTESDLHRIVKEAVDGIYKMYSNTSPSPHHTVEYGIKKQTEKRRAESAKRRAERNNNKGLETENTIISEDGEAGGGGATNAAGVMQGGGTNPGAGQYDVPAFAKKKQNKVGGNPWKEPIMRQKHNLGDVTKAPANQVDIEPALKRGGSIAMGENFERKINEAVDEGIGNWLKGAALGGMMALSPMQANAQQTQGYNPTSIEQQAPMSKENAKQILQKWNSMSPIPSITKQEAQNKVFNVLSMSEYGKVGTTTNLLNSILIKSQNGNFLTGDNFSLNDIQTIYKKYGNNVAIMQIDGTKYFVNIDAMGDWDF
jgi:hypothetical protein